MNERKCPFVEELKDGYCEHKRIKNCDGCGEIKLDERLDVIDKSEMCKRGSIFGNSFYVITRKDIECLLNGKVLFSLGEYGVFIGLWDRDLEEENR